MSGLTGGLLVFLQDVTPQDLLHKPGLAYKAMNGCSDQCLIGSISVVVQLILKPLVVMCMTENEV